MSNLDVHSRLVDHPFASGLEPTQVARLAELGKIRRWGSGELLFREGDRDTALYLVIEGRIALDVAHPKRGRMVLMTIGPGEVFGWSSLLGGKSRKAASARAVEETSALALDADRLIALCDSDPRLGYTLMKRVLHVVEERLKATRMQVMDLFGG
jgi:CRP/FNR family transcriptional regulator, cyclic AMP receptor protein